MQQAQMQQPKGIGLIIVAVLVVLGLRSRNGGGGDAGATLAGWSVQVSQPTAIMGHDITRTVTATGTVKNTGQLRASYEVKLSRSTLLLDFANLVLDPGQSQTVNLSNSVFLKLADGEAVTMFVDLDRVSPSAATEIDSAGPFRYTELHGHAVGGALTGWSANVAQRHGLRARR